MSRVLLVSDGSWVANEVRAALSLGEWEIEEESDPRRISDVYETRKPDALIVDMQVGSMGGMAVIREIRSNFDEDEWPRMVLLLDRSADEFLAHRAGAHASVLKPINAAALRAALDPTLMPSGAVEEEEEE